MSYCTFFIKGSENPPNLQQIKQKLSKGSLSQKCNFMKQLVKCLVSDEHYPPIIMHIITTIIPIQHQSAQLRKIMLLYWQVIEKSKSPTDKSLKEEIFLACNSLRNDLLCHNQYLRGRTLRLISRIMHRGVIQPLASAISSNLDHKSSYVRRNAVVCLYNVFVTFGSDIIGDIDDEIQELLQKQTDLSTKRNAFLLLNKSNPQKALKYLQQQISFQAVQQIGDILQLSILKILKQKCKQQPSLKPKLLKIVSDFSSKTQSQSIKLQCALTSTSISNSSLTIKSSLYSYIAILTKTHQLNIKKIILDRLEVICKNSNYLQQDMIQDLIRGLDTPSVQIKMKILKIVMMGVTAKTSQMVIKQMEHQINNNDQKTNDQDYLIGIIKILQIIVFKFNSTHSEILNIIISKIFVLDQILRQGVDSINNIIKKILIDSEKKKLSQVKFTILNSFDKINSKQLIKITLNILGNFFQKQSDIQKVITKLKVTIGCLPLCLSTPIQAKSPSSPQQSKVFKTIILQDGSYSTQLVHQTQISQQLQQSKQSNYSFRNFLVGDSIIGGIFARTIGKLLWKIRKMQGFNKHACSILMVLCSLIRYYQDNIFQVDQAIVQEISLIIRKIVQPNQFINTSTDNFFQNHFDYPIEPKYDNYKESQMIQKNPQDLINFRLLKKGGQLEQNFDFDDDQVNELIVQQVQKKDFITKLKSLVQLTGPFDPLYCQSFISISKYDIFFQILLINTTKHNLLNIQIQFSSPSPILILQKALSVNLRSKESVVLRTQLRFVGLEFGVIYGYINFDNHSGLEQPYLITEEISVDYMGFILPAKIRQQQFKSGWERIPNQVVHQKVIQTKNLTFKQIINHYQETLHAKCVETLNDDEQFFLNCHLYGKSKLGEDFFVNVALFTAQNISSTVTIRSKDQAVQQIVFKQLKKCSFQHLNQQEQSD